MRKVWLIANLLLLVDSSNARKTINFGHYGPQGCFVTVPNYNTSDLPASLNDPFEVVKAFISGLSSKLDGYSYKIRKDSYIDAGTEVTHVYARQTYNGLDIVDGDFNVNIMGGQVISYGNEVSCFPSFDVCWLIP